MHAVAPDAAIREVLISDAAAETPAKASAAVTAALRLGATRGAVISFSHSWGEQCFTAAEVAQLNAALQAVRNAAVTVVNSSGDTGASTNPCPGARIGLTGIKGVNLLDADPLVLAAGGTSLQANHATGAYMSETVWNTPPGQTGRGFSVSSGGGFSHLFSRPAYQNGVSGIGASRGVPDVAADADPNTGMALALTDGGQNSIVVGAGGTSAAAPLWAAVIALADQYAGRHLGLVNPALYRIGRSRGRSHCVPRHHHRDEHRRILAATRVGSRSRRPAAHCPGCDAPNHIPVTDRHGLRRRAWMGPGHGLGKPRRAGARTPPRPLRQPVTVSAGLRSAAAGGTESVADDGEELARRGAPGVGGRLAGAEDERHHGVSGHVAAHRPGVLGPLKQHLDRASQLVLDPCRRQLEFDTGTGDCHQEVALGRPLLDDVLQEAEEGAGCVRRISLGARVGRQSSEAVEEDGLTQLLLCRKVAIQRADADARLLGDQIDRHLDPLGREDDLRRLEDAGSVALGVCT